MNLNCNLIVPNLLNDPLYEYSDTFSWSRGKHALKFGGDVRLPRTNGYGFQPYIDTTYGNLGGTTTQSPLATETAGTGTPSLGATTVTLAAGQTYQSVYNGTATQAFNFRGTSRTLASNLAYLLTDSIGCPQHSVLDRKSGGQGCRPRGLAGHHDAVQPLPVDQSDGMGVFRQR